MNLNPRNPSPWKFWCFRLMNYFLKMLLGCAIGFPILIYLLIPAILWIFADIPYTWPTSDQLMKWVRYGFMCTAWVGSVLWLSEFLPWLIRVLRSRRNGDPM